MKRISMILTIVLLLLAVPTALAESTQVPGHERYDTDNNGYPDEGVMVNGHYTSLFAYECLNGCEDANYDGFPDNDGWYWDLGDGRIMSSPGVSSVDDLDQGTLTVCDYEVNYRADFGNDPYMNDGWILNHINCKGFDDNSVYNYLIVSDEDPRYTGNPDWAIWGTWEYHTLTISGYGNLVRPETHVGE